jgi:hypothetical protein
MHTHTVEARLLQLCAVVPVHPQPQEFRVVCSASQTEITTFANEKLDPYVHQYTLHDLRVTWLKQPSPLGWPDVIAVVHVEHHRTSIVSIKRFVVAIHIQ